MLSTFWQNNMIKPAKYWRDRQEVSKWYGRVGTVVVSTTIQVSSPEFADFSPYDYALVDFEDERHEFMAVPGLRLNPGDRVQLVLRKLTKPDASGLIEYGLKLNKI